MLNTIFTTEDHEGPSSGYLQLQGSATLEFSTELCAALLDSLDKTENLVVDVSRITDLDVSALQLFCAARRSAIKRRKNMVLGKNPSETFYTTVLDAGFNRPHTANCWLTAGTQCLWGACKPAAGEVKS